MILFEFPYRQRRNCYIVDVRRPDEFAEGHIAGAINVPNENIEDEMPAELPDKEHLLLIYCLHGIIEINTLI